MPSRSSGIETSRHSAGLLLKVLRPDGRFDEFYLAGGLTIGRSVANTIILAEDDSVDRTHARVEIAEDGAARLRCVEPGSSLIANDATVQELPLETGVRFLIGRTAFVCVSGRRVHEECYREREFSCPFCGSMDFPKEEREARPCPGCNNPILPVPLGENSLVSILLPVSYGEYQADRYVTRGGMGVVLKGTRSVDPKPLAIKVLLPGTLDEQREAERYAQEVSMLSRVSHPNVVKLLDHGQSGRFHFLILEWIEGSNLRQLIAEANRKRKYKRFTTTFRWFEQVGKGLAAIHSVGMIHRDLKPSNILIDDEGVARITDLGIAKRIDSALTTYTRTGYAPGTYEYMAPEQISAPDTVDARTDLYALGVTFYELLTGTRPVGAWQPASTINPTVPKSFDEILRRLMAPRPEHRWNDVYELLAAISVTTDTSSAGSVERLLKPERQRILDPTSIDGAKSTIDHSQRPLYPEGDRETSNYELSPQVTMARETAEIEAHPSSDPVHTDRNTLSSDEAIDKFEVRIKLGDSLLFNKRVYWELILSEEGVKLFDSTGELRSHFEYASSEEAFILPSFVSLGTKLRIKGNNKEVYQFRTKRTMIFTIRTYLDNVLKTGGPEAIRRYKKSAYDLLLSGLSWFLGFVVFPIWRNTGGTLSGPVGVMNFLRVIVMLCILIRVTRGLGRLSKAQAIENLVRESLHDDNVDFHQESRIATRYIRDAVVLSLTLYGSPIAYWLSLRAYWESALRRKRRLVPLIVTVWTGSLSFMLVYGLISYAIFRVELGREENIQGLTHFAARNYEKALWEFNHSIEKKPDSAVYANRAACYMARNQFDLAISDCNEAIHLNPTLGRAFRTRGIALRNKRQYNEAIVDLTEAIGRKPDGEDPLFDRGLAYLSKYLFNETNKESEQPILSAPLRAALYSERGFSHFCKNEFDQTIEDCTRAIELDQSLVQPLVWRGTALGKQGKYEQAIADLTKAISLDPKQKMAYSSRGTAHQNKGEHDLAIADFDAAIKLDPKDSRDYSNRGLSYAMKGEHDRSVEDCSKAIKLDSTNLSAFLWRSSDFQAKGDLRRAVADLDESIRIDPSFAPGLNARGMIFYEQGDHKKAIADYTEAIRISPSLAQAYNNRGLVLKTMGEYEKALADYAEAIRLDPKLAEAFNRRAWLWATCPDIKYRDGKPAVKSATFACELTGWKDAINLGTLAAAYAECGDFDVAALYQEKALKLYSDQAELQAGQKRLEMYQAKMPFHEQPTVK